MCEDGKLFEVALVLGLIVAFIVFVAVVNWMAYKDNEKFMDKLYPRG